MKQAPRFRPQNGSRLTGAANSDKSPRRFGMKLDQILRLIVVAIVLMVAFSLLGFLLRIGSVLIGLAVKILVILLLVAVVLRFIDLLRGKQA